MYRCTYVYYIHLNTLYVGKCVYIVHQMYTILKPKVTKVLGQYNRTAGRKATHIGPINIIGRETRLTWGRVV